MTHYDPLMLFCQLPKFWKPLSDQYPLGWSAKSLSWFKIL